MSVQEKIGQSLSRLESGVIHYMNREEKECSCCGFLIHSSISQKLDLKDVPFRSLNWVLEHTSVKNGFTWVGEAKYIQICSEIYWYVRTHWK